MSNLVERIMQVNEYEIEKILKAVMERYSQLFPDWNPNIFFLQKSADPNEQIDGAIKLLQSMKPYN